MLLGLSTRSVRTRLRNRARANWKEKENIWRSSLAGQPTHHVELVFADFARNFVARLAVHFEVLEDPQVRVRHSQHELVQNHVEGACGALDAHDGLGLLGADGHLQSEAELEHFEHGRFAALW